ncbi:MAG: wax ester/triacylglycerol synthase family O-acyltransferase [Burkholderiaceae bacterium]|nr:wax ester/triacylglycerol synthase family O-acyltransferase [Burkholderiaceae bacterium]
MKQLSGLDATFLYLETDQMPMHVGAVNIFELPPGTRGRFATRLRQHMAERLPLTPVLRRRLWWMPLNLANPAWVDAEPDLSWHIIEHKLPASAKQGNGQAEIEDLVGQLHAQRLDRQRPLWRMHVLEGLAPAADGSKRVALYSKFHHAAVDGQAAVALAKVILDLSPGGRELQLKPSSRRKVFQLGSMEMLRGALASEAAQVARIVKQLPSTVGTLADAAGQALRALPALGGDAKRSSNIVLAPRTPFNQNVGESRAFAGVSLPLPWMKAVAREHGATLNDIVLLLCSTALRRWLAAHGGVPRKSLIAAVPISLREAGDTTPDNQASMSLVSLGTHLSDLRRRLAHIKAATAAMKSTMGNLKSVLPTDFPSIGVPWLMEAVTSLYGKARVAERVPQLANVVISNVPGPPVPLYLAGARMRCNWPTSIVVHGIALNITVESYDQQMDFGLVADGAAVADLRALAEALRAAFDELPLLDPVKKAPPGPAEALPALARSGRRMLDGMVDTVSSKVGGKVGSVARSMVGTVVKSAVSGALSSARGRVKASAAAPAKAEAAGSAAGSAARAAAPGRRGKAR